MSDSTENLTKVHIDLPNHWWFKGESLWAKALGNDLYEIQNVPFCAYGLNCGDVVSAVASDPTLKPEVVAVVSRSGNETLRASFLIDKEHQAPIIEEIEATGAWVERANPTFICINVPPSTQVATVRELLDRREAEEVLQYETCEERVTGSFDDRPGDSDEE